MKVFLISCVTAIVIAVVGGVVLNNVPDSASQSFSSPSSVRL